MLSEAVSVDLNFTSRMFSCSQSFGRRFNPMQDRVSHQLGHDHLNRLSQRIRQMIESILDLEIHSKLLPVSLGNLFRQLNERRKIRLAAFSSIFSEDLLHGQQTADQIVGHANLVQERGQTVGDWQELFPT